MIIIDLKLRLISQLFDSRDPSPFLERDLDDDAADYIVSATLEHNMRTPIALVIHLSDSESFTLDPKIVVESIHNHFSYNADLISKKMTRTWRQGQVSLLIGAVVLFSCLSIAQSIPLEKAYSYLAVLREGMIIMGWVAMWRPIDIFFYSWWPQIEMRRVFLKLAKVPVEIKVQEKS